MPRGPRLTEEERELRRAEIQRKRDDLHDQLVLTKDFISPKRWEELSRIAVRRIQERQFGAEDGLPEEEEEDDYDKKKDSDEESDEDEDGEKKGGKRGKKSKDQGAKRMRKL